MKRGQMSLVWILASLVLLLGANTVAAGPPDEAAEMPAIFASLDAGDVIVLDAGTAATVRGQGAEYRYVLVKVLGLNALDFAPAIDWTWNPFLWRYGAFGGAGWTNGGLTEGSAIPADTMDTLFKGHDQGILSDAQLLFALGALPNANGGFWGTIYAPAWITPGSNLPAGENVWVSGASLFGSRFFFGWKPMPYPEYARRQARTAIGLLTLLP